MANLSEAAKRRKVEYNAEYQKKNNYAAQNAYNKQNMKSFAFRFNLNTEADIIEWLEQQDNKAGYIKELIRADMAKRK